MISSVAIFTIFFCAATTAENQPIILKLHSDDSYLTIRKDVEGKTLLSLNPNGLVTRKLSWEDWNQMTSESFLDDVQMAIRLLDQPPIPNTFNQEELCKMPDYYYYCEQGASVKQINMKNVTVAAFFSKLDGTTFWNTFPNTFDLSGWNQLIKAKDKIEEMFENIEE